MEERRVLDSWKEIAAYLGRSVKTCRRWEHELGLPVHRLEESPKARVFAYPDEVDQWVKTTQRSDENQLKTKHLFKNKSHLYVLGAVLLILVITAGFIFLIQKKPAPLDSIAILPIVNDSDDPSEDFFASSLTDRLIAEFYKVSAVKIVSRQAVMAYADTTKSPQQIARELNVKAIVEASVLKSGNKVRLIARLIDPKHNKQLWSDIFVREYSDILYLQSDLVQAIIKGINVAVEPEERARLASARKVNPEAYDLCLQGINQWLLLMDTDMSNKNRRLKAKSLLEKAIAIDSTLGLAHSTLSQIYWELGATQQMPAKVAFAESKKAALKALDLDKNDVDAIAILAGIKWADWDFSGAEMDYIHAIELEPGNYTTKFKYYSFLAGIGRFDEAIEGQRQLIKDSPFRRVALAQRPYYYLLAGRYDDAIEAAEEGINLGLDTHIFLASANALKGMHVEALSLMENLAFPGVQEDTYDMLDIACILALSGKREDALKKLEDIKAILSPELGLDSSYETACVLGALGDNDKAFQFLKRAYENHHPSMMSLKSDYWLHRLNGDQRFEDLLKKVGFPSTATSGKR